MFDFIDWTTLLIWGKLTGSLLLGFAVMMGVALAFRYNLSKEMPTNTNVMTPTTYTHEYIMYSCLIIGGFVVLYCKGYLNVF